MANEYIRRKDAAKLLGHIFGVDVVRRLHEVPAVDVAPVVHARWKRIRSNWYCTGCDKGYKITNGAPAASSFGYCPNCGAKMDGGEKDG